LLELAGYAINTNRLSGFYAAMALTSAEADL
jgi:hypothetical protein